MSHIQDGINKLVAGDSLNQEETQKIMREIMTGECSEAQIGSFLTALRIRGETPEIIAGAAQIMRECSNRIKPNTTSTLVDTCGTGGDKADTFNISTLASIIASGAGVVIAKHGNRSVSSKCGAADILEAFGVNIAMEPAEVEKIIEKIGIGFMFAPKFHPAMKHVMPARRSLKMRTVFNILGPLTNPANAPTQILGVFDKDLIKTMAEVLLKLGSTHVYIVNSDPGIDEIIPISVVHIAEIKDGQIKYYSKEREDFGLEPFELADVQGGNLEKNVEIAKNILTNKDTGIKREIALINATYAILCSDSSLSYKEAYEKAKDSLISGKALAKLKSFVEASGGDLKKFTQIFN